MAFAALHPHISETSFITDSLEIILQIVSIVKKIFLWQYKLSQILYRSIIAGNKDLLV